MKELSHEARSVLERGLALDGPSDARRARVKQRVFLALGSGAVTLSGAAAATGAGGVAAGGAVVASGKGLVAASLWLWFGVGAALGVGVGGVVAVARLSSVTPASIPHAVSTVGALAPTTKLSGSRASESAPAPVAESPEAPNVDLTGTAPPTGPLGGHAVPAEPEPVFPLPSAAMSSTLQEEAALLQRAQRALATKQPEQALLLLREHERRFANGALNEERKVATILALCALGRENEARVLGRAFVSTSPSSVLIPRLQQSCAGTRR